jgi:FAD/FMN-containing dehydrogenase
MALARTLLPQPSSPLAPSRLIRFGDRFRGEIIRPDAPGYDAARAVLEKYVDRRPALVVRPIDARDVAEAIRFARADDLEIAVRSGGHSVAGHSTTDGGLLIDLGALRGLHLDPAGRTAWVGAGLRAGDVTAAAHEHGLAVPFGDTASVGVGGITLGGGIGWLARKHGLTIDSLIAAELVTADGEILTVSEERHPDLFWAIRGGGGNFGIVTRFQFRLHEAGMVVGGALALPLTGDVLTGLVEAASEAPEELTTITLVMPLPPAPFVPAEHHGRPAVVVMPVHVGDLEAGQRAMAPIRALAEPYADIVGPMPYPAMYQLTAAGSEPHAMALHSTFADELTPAIAEQIAERMSAPEAAAAMFQVRVLGGAVARVPAGATAFAHRERRLMFMAGRMFEGAADEVQARAWIGDVAKTLRPVAHGVYSNFLADEGEARIHEAYPDETYRRLAAIKRRYDPANLFRLNQNIRAE